jgi:hypothetical protein
MNQVDAAVLAPPAQHSPTADRGAQPAPDPLPWPGMSKAECVLLAILLHRASAAREVGV